MNIECQISVKGKNGSKSYILAEVEVKETPKVGDILAFESNNEREIDNYKVIEVERYFRIDRKLSKDYKIEYESSLITAWVEFVKTVKV